MVVESAGGPAVFTAVMAGIAVLRHARGVSAKIVRIERVLVAANDLAEARQSWSAAGFALAPERIAPDGTRYLRAAAGAIAIDLCAAPTGDGALKHAMEEALTNGGGIVGWTWGVAPDYRGPAAAEPDGAVRGETSFGGRAVETALPGVFSALTSAGSEAAVRSAALADECGANRNTADYLEHIVVMTPQLEEAIARYERLGVPCRRIRETGRGMRQAFFKLEQTVIEVVGPSLARPGGWGLAFMCSDIAAAVACARSAGLKATEPKPAIQGGLIARIVEPLDGVAVAYMQAAR